jgi:hypothetical protein
MWIGSNSFACILIYLVRSMKATSLFPLALQISASILHKQEMTNSYMYPYLQGIVSHIMCAEGTHIVHKESISTLSWRLWYKIKQAVLVDPHFLLWNEIPMFGLQIRIILAPSYTSLFCNIHVVDMSLIVWSLLRAPIFVCNIKFVDGNTTIWNQPWYLLCCQIQDNLNLEQTTCQIPNIVSNLWPPNSKHMRHW